MKIITASNGKQIVKMSKKEWEDIGKNKGWKVAFGPTNNSFTKDPKKEEFLKKLKRLTEIFSKFSVVSTSMNREFGYATLLFKDENGYYEQQSIVLSIPNIIAKMGLKEDFLSKAKETANKIYALNREAMKLSEEIGNSDFVGDEDLDSVMDCFIPVSSAEDVDRAAISQREDGAPENLESKFRAKKDPYDLAVLIEVGILGDEIKEKIQFLEGLYAKVNSTNKNVEQNQMGPMPVSDFLNRSKTKPAKS